MGYPLPVFNKNCTLYSQHVARSRRQSSRSSRRTFPSPHIFHSLSALSKMNTIPYTPNQLENQNSVFMCPSICSRPSANETKPLRGTKQISLNLLITCPPYGRASKGRSWDPSDSDGTASDGTASEGRASDATGSDGTVSDSRASDSRASDPGTPSLWDAVAACAAEI